MASSRGPLFIAGIALLLIATGASLLLALEHLGALSLPGCGQDSPCARAAASAWGRVPGLGWPTAFLGLAYFAGALFTWIAARGRAVGPWRMIVRLGALISAGFLLVLLFKGYACNYCLAAHLANFGFLFIVERAARLARTRGAWLHPLAPVVSLALVFVIVSAVLALLEVREKAAVAQRQESERTESTAEIIAATLAAGQNATDSGEDPEAGAVGAGEVGAGADGVSGDETSPTGAPASDPGLAGGIQPPWKGAFTGRYRLGPEKAAVRIVIYTDYQCRDCARIEQEIERLLASREKVSLSVKQFPMCRDCNPNAERTLHPNACWAARAAEAAGILRGSEGFFQMHRWLFSVGGSFDRNSLQTRLAEWNYDPTEFAALMNGTRVLDLIHADVEEGMWLGLHYTPMVFVNGVEMKGIFSPNAITRTVEEVLLRSPQPLTASVDQPPPALQKYVDDWWQQPRRDLRDDGAAWTLGPTEAPIEVVVWGDYQEPNTAQADQALRERVGQRGNMRYTFRHFPVQRDCNPIAEVDRHPQACAASRAAEAAGRLGGNEAYWRMHAWLFENRERFSEAAVLAAAREMGLDEQAFQRTLADPELTQAIREDCLATRSLGLTAVPSIFVNGRFLPRWKLAGASPLDLILERAAAESGTPGAAGGRP
ncbi:MAG: thioredoxin domain-containing protein [Candidatus Eisenbacteria bacterium]